MLSPEDILRKYWGYDTFRPMQREIIESVLSGRDTLGLLPTGGGKSITFQVPAMALDGLTLVVTPLISLMKDQVDNLREIGIRAYCLHSAMTRRESRLALDKCLYGGARLLYLSPEKLQVASFRNELSRLPVRLIVVDEAHCISQWGYDFRPSYLLIAKVRRMFPDAPVLALTASATREVIDDIMSRLEFRERTQLFRRSFTRENISYIARYCDFKDHQLLHIVSRLRGTGIVYTRSRKRTRELAEMLCKAGESAGYYHAGLLAEEKTDRQNSWKSGRTRIIVATNAFGMGIDKPDVRFVIHYDLPSSLEEYYQEAGRAGRDGLESFAVVLASKADKGVLTRRLSDSFPDREYIMQVYEQLCVYLSVGMGEGAGKLSEFSLDGFARRFRLRDSQAHNALGILSRSGYIEYIEETSTRSRLMMVMQRHELYSLRLDREVDDLLQLVLRTYTGIFADYEFISESLLAMRLNVTEQAVYERLILLGKMHVIHYVPRKTTPYIFFPVSRQPVADLRLPREVYELRRKQMEQRLTAMKNFVFSTDRCRVSTLLRYFNEEPACDCGKCDVCRSRRASQRDTAAAGAQAEKRVADAIRRSQGPVSLTELSLRTNIDLKAVAEHVRKLCDRREARLLPGGMVEKY